MSRIFLQFIKIWHNSQKIYMLISEPTLKYMYTISTWLKYSIMFHAVILVLSESGMKNLLFHGSNH